MLFFSPVPYISALKDGVLRHRADKADSVHTEKMAQEQGVKDPTQKSKELRDKHNRDSQEFENLHQVRKNQNNMMWNEQLENTKKNNQEYKP